MSPTSRRAAATRRRGGQLRLVVAAHKGGAGKSTAAVNLAAALAEMGRRTLVVDVDPQGAATAALGVRLGKASLHHVLTGTATMAEAIVPTAVEGLDVLGADLDLAGDGVTLARAPGWQSRLREALDAGAGDYQVVVIDSAPGLGVIPFLALVAGDQVLVAAPPSFLTLRAMSQVMDTVAQAEAFNQGLRVLGIVPSIVGSRTLHRDEVLEELEKRWPGLILPSLPRRVVFEDAAALGQAVVTFAPTSTAAAAVRALASEVVARAEA